MSFASLPDESPKQGSTKIKYTGKKKVLKEGTAINPLETVPDSDDDEVKGKSNDIRVKGDTSPSAAQDGALSVEKKKRSRVDSTQLPGPQPRHKRSDSVDSRTSITKTPTGTARRAKSRSRTNVEPPLLVAALRAEKPLSSRAKSNYLGTPDRQTNVSTLFKSPTRSPESPSRRASRVNHSPEVSRKTNANGENGPNDDASSVAPSIAESGTVSSATTNATGFRRGMEERQLLLEQDPLTGEVKPHEAFCKECDKWIRLTPKIKYSLGPWQRHAEKKHGIKSFVGPSLRVQEAERKLQLVNDPQAGEFDARSVTCQICGQTVRLSEKIPFDLEIWEAHKFNCAGASTSPTDDQHVNGTSADVVVETPLIESNSKGLCSDLTLAENISSSVSTSTPVEVEPATGQKRRRDDSDSEDVSNRPATKLKTLEPTVVSKPSRSALTWLLLPWEAFKQGFRESMKS